MRDHFLGYGRKRKLASLGPVQPLVVGHYGEMGGYVGELLVLAADAGADKHWQSMLIYSTPNPARLYIIYTIAPTIVP